MPRTIESPLKGWNVGLRAPCYGWGGSVLLFSAWWHLVSSSLSPAQQVTGLGHRNHHVTDSSLDGEGFEAGQTYSPASRRWQGGGHR